jgi:hypothetical protein
MNPEPYTFQLQHRLASENPRVVEFRFSDKPDEVFRDRAELFRSRGLREESYFDFVQRPSVTKPQHES